MTDTPNDWFAHCPERFKENFSQLRKSAKSDNCGKRNANSHQEAEILGKFAEAITARYLLQQGYPIREWGWQPSKGKGQIDLITQKGNRIVFVEVKARNGKSGDPWDAINKSKIKDLCKGADIYLKMQTETFDYQFDIALLTGDFNDYKLEYIEDAFMCPLISNR